MAASLTFGDLLRHHRLTAGLTQDALAERAGLSVHGVQKLERGVTHPHRATLHRLLLALRLSADDQAELRKAAGVAPRLHRVQATVDAPRHNLPVPVTSFIGRQPEIAEVSRRLTDVRLLTLTGVGGCGKTRLALEAARTVLERHPDGVWLVDLAPVQASHLVPFAIAAVLGRRERPGEALLDTLVAYLSTRRLLLVLDNCEHLIEICAALAERILSHCPLVRILATSREQLRIGGEVTWRVPSLASPDSRGTLSPSDLLDYPAAQLFVDRVRAAQPEFALTSANASSVAGICARVEGLPLALELAAARVAALSLPQILERLDDSIRLLVGGSRTAPSRQQTLRATLDWSYRLLNDQERAVFERLAVFAADCSLDAAEAVCAAGDVAASDVLDLLQQLVDKSLVVAEEHSGSTRYRLLEPVRQYARERLIAAGELETVRRRHAFYFLNFGERRERAANVGGRERTAAAAALVQEYPNIRVALGWSLESGEAQIGLRLARTVQFLWISRGYPGEGLGWLEELLVLPGAEEPTAARTVCLLAAGYLATTRDNFEAARKFYEAGLPLARTIDDPWVQWVAPQNFAVYNWTRGDLDTAVRYQREALAIARVTDDRVDEAISLSVWATIAAAQGDYAEAQALAEDGRRLAHAVGEEWIESLALVYMGLLALHRGDNATARGVLEQALKIGRRQGDPFRIAQALEGLGQLATAEGRPADAHAFLAEALKLLDGIGHRATIAATLESFAALAARFSRPEAALQLAGAAAAVREAFGVPQSRLRRDLLDRWLPALQLAAAEDLRARNWAIGKAMSIQQAIALADTLQASVPPLTDAVRKPVPQVPGLTSREVEVLRLVAQGQSNKEIAAELVLSVRTVERHITNLYGKIDARGKADATAYAFKHGLL